MFHRFAALLAVGMLFAGPVVAQDDPMDELIRQEELRALVDDAFERYGELQRSEDDRTRFVPRYVDLVFELGSADPEVVPLLASEMLQGNPSTFFMSAYALAIQGTPEAIEAMLEAIKRADREGSQFAEARKGHLIWTLALTGDSRAVTLADSGRHRVSAVAAYRSMTMLETAAIFGGDEALALLHQEYSAPDLEDQDKRLRIKQVIRSMGRVAAPASKPLLLKGLTSTSSGIRQAVVEALQSYGDKDVVDALFLRLKDEDYRVATAAGYALLAIEPEGRFDQVAKELETQINPEVRVPLYELLVRLDPKRALEELSKYLGRTDQSELRGLIFAARQTELPEAIDILGVGLARNDGATGPSALIGIGKIEGDRANSILLRAIDSPSWSLAQQASRIATERRIAGAEKKIRTRLLEGELPKLVNRADSRPAAEWLLDQLRDWGDTDAIEPLREQLEIQKDGLLLERIRRTLTVLESYQRNGDDLDKWSASLVSESADERTAALNYLKRQDHPEVGKRLAQAFDQLDLEDAIPVVQLCGQFPGDETTALIERLLTRPEFQSTRFDDLRDAAAWAARGIGGERMVQALAASITARNGRDARVLSYYALLAGKDAVATIEKYLVSRMRYRQTLRGNEWNHLKRLLRLLKSERAIDFTDRPPQALTFITG